jgi:hypothetical protein
MLNQKEHDKKEQHTWATVSVVEVPVDTTVGSPSKEESIIEGFKDVIGRTR